MSVYIKGMEMPVTCCHCPLAAYDAEIKWIDAGKEAIGAWLCLLTHELIDNTKREENCPLIEVPEPHGRLGDLDALKNKWTHKDLDLFSQGWSWLRDLNKAPTVIPASEEG